MSGAPKQLPTLSKASQKRWALGGCLGCSGFALLAFVLALVGVKRSLQPENVWAQLSAYVDFEAPPEGFQALFVVPFFDQRQIAFYRVADKTEVILEEYSSRMREDFDEAFSVAKLIEGGARSVKTGTLRLQGRDVEYVTFLGGETAAKGGTRAPEERGGLQGWILETFALAPEDPPVFPLDTPILRMRFSGASDSGGTVLMVRSPGAEPMTAAQLEDLFTPFDLWSRVDSTPAPPPKDPVD